MRREFPNAGLQYIYDAGKLREKQFLDLAHKMFVWFKAL